jgi:transposase
MTASSLPYPAHLSEQEWALLLALLPPAKAGGRPRSVDLRRICGGSATAALKLFGRKRHVLVDTLGMVVKALVHPADLQGRASAPGLLLTVADAVPRLELIWADSVYRSWSGQADAEARCAPTRSRPSASPASRSSRDAGRWSGPSPGSGATAA